MNYLSAHPDGVTLPAMVRALKMPRSSVVRIVNTYELYGFIEKRDRRYLTTSTFQEWVVKDRHRLFRQKYRPMLEAISKEVEELVLLGVEENRAIVHIDYIEWDHRIRVAPAPITRHGLERNAMGKLALSKRPDLLTKLKNNLLRQEIEEVRKTGIAWNREETDKGMVVMAAYGVTRSPAEPVLAVAWPTIRFSEAKAARAWRVIERVVMQDGG